MSLQTVKKTTKAELDYGFDLKARTNAIADGLPYARLTDWLVSGESISSVVWVIPAGLTKGDEVTGSYTAKVWLSGGTDGETYEISCTITSSAGRVDEFTMDIIMEEH